MGNTLLQKESSYQIAKPGSLLAWSSWKSNNISIIELNNKTKYANFKGVQLKSRSGTYLHIYF